jgi:hypothetical protein
MSEVSLRSRLIGAWELVNFVVRDVATNAERRPWGEHPLGLILYTHDGYVSAQLQRPGRGPFVRVDGYQPGCAASRSRQLASRALPDSRASSHGGCRC